MTWLEFGERKNGRWIIGNITVHKCKHIYSIRVQYVQLPYLGRMMIQGVNALQYLNSLPYLWLILSLPIVEIYSGYFIKYLYNIILALYMQKRNLYKAKHNSIDLQHNPLYVVYVQWDLHSCKCLGLQISIQIIT